MPTRVRLNKFLRDCQLGSRRKCEKLIEDGLVTVNGQKVSQVGTLVDPAKDEVRVEGNRVRPFRETLYIAAYKPRGVVVTAYDPQGRETVYQAMADLPKEVFAVGRLDLDSEGLLLLTNDGKLGFRLSHPRFAIERIYEVGVSGKVTEEIVMKLTGGIQLEEGMAKARRVRLLREDRHGSTLELALAEGKKREIRRMMAAVGFEVTSLKRIRFGNVSLGELEPGNWRYLTREEVRGLRRLVEESYLSKLKRV